MKRLAIKTIPEPILRQKSQKMDVSEINTPEMQEFFDDLIFTMYEDDGVGIAAPQVGQSIQACVIGKNSLAKNFQINKELYFKLKDLVLINPTWEPISKKTTKDTEGCLSVPKVFGDVKRQKDIRVTALLRDGQKIQFDASNFFARVIQHEVDHLNGVLFIDRASDLFTNEEDKAHEHFALLKTQNDYRL